VSDPNNPPPQDQPPQPGYGQQPSYGQQPGYGQQPAHGQQPPPAAGGDFPGKTLGIIGLVLSFFTTIIGLIISIVALRQSKKACFKNTPALVGVIVGIVTTVLAIIIGGIAIAGVIALLDQCAQLGPGVHNVNGVTVRCGG
jgi:hypothetical protein